MKPGQDRYGIHMARYIREHERYMRGRLEQSGDRQTLLDYHLQKIGWLQHERLIHLIVTALVAVLLLFLYGLALLTGGQPLVIALLAGAAVLFVAYLVHYFRLENAVQRWYQIADPLIRQKIEDETKDETKPQAKSESESEPTAFKG